MKTLLRRTLCLAVLGAAYALPAQAQVNYLNDSFEVYSSLPDLQNVHSGTVDGEWEEWTAAREASMSFSTEDPDGTPNKAIAMSPATTNGSAGHLVHNLLRSTWGPVEAPSNEAPLVFSFRFFDHMVLDPEADPETETPLNGRIFGVIRPVASANFVAMGIYYPVDTGTYDVTRYQARVMGGGNWIQLAAKRRYGWNTFKAVIHYDTVDIYVNGELDPNGTALPRNPGAIIEQVNLGGALSTQSGGIFDDVRVYLDFDAARNITVDQHPESISVAVGDDATFTVVATGDNPLTYRWERDSEPMVDGDGISGVNTDTLTIASVDFDDDAFYRVALNDGPVREYTAAAKLTVQPFLFTQQPATQVVQFGDDGVFSVAVHGEGPFTYQWQREGEDLVDGGRISGAPTDTLTISDVEAGDSGTYRVVVTNVHGTRNSATVALSGGPPPTGVRFADFEQFAAPSVNGTILFRHPGFSGSSRGVATSTNSTQVVEDFPPGTWGSRVLRAAWAFDPNYTAEEPWLRLTTFGTATLPNPIIGFDRFLRFEIYANEDVYVTLGVRDGNETGDYGTAGGASAGILWIGGDAENPGPAGTPQEGVLVTKGSWQTVAFDIPNEFVKRFSGEGPPVLTGSKGTLEHLAFRPVRDKEGKFPADFQVYLDNFEVTEVAPEIPDPDAEAPTVTITRSGAGEIELLITGEPTTEYTIEWVGNLGDEWQVLGTETTSPSGEAVFTDSEATSNDRRFYRVSLP